MFPHSVTAQSPPGFAENWPSLRKLLESRDIAIKFHGPAEPTMEDVFIDLVRAEEHDSV